MTDHYLFENIPLSYSFDALEPYIDTETMYLHHHKHLQTYIDNLNNILKDHSSLQSLSLEQLILSAKQLPEAIGTPISKNAGGVYNHLFFFDGISPNSDGFPDGRLAKAIDKHFGSFDGFMEAFKTAALSIFGSGYAWLTSDKQGTLQIATTANQDTPLTMELCPIISIDVWEHAYYLKHHNLRADYISDWFMVADWQKACENYWLCIFSPQQ